MKKTIVFGIACSIVASGIAGEDHSAANKKKAHDRMQKGITQASAIMKKQNTQSKQCVNPASEEFSNNQFLSALARYCEVINQFTPLLQGLNS